MHKSTNSVVYFDWKTVIYIYVCGKCRTQFMLPMEKSVTFTGACANEIIPSINRSFVYKAKEGRHVRIIILTWRPSFAYITPFFRFVDKREIYRWYNLIRTCAGECDWLFHWQHKLCAIFSAKVNINYRLPIKVYYRICTLWHIRIEINHGSQNVFWILTWVGGY
jgi:hypothetical protein